jgi:starch phosphorylase
MFHGLWPDLDVDEVPITSITNGVHGLTWAAPEVMELSSRYGSLVRPEDYARALTAITDAELWTGKRAMRARLVEEVRRRLRASWRQRGALDPALDWVEEVLDPDVLTIGFARRVPAYKRLTLMLRDPERLRSLLLDHERPIQLVIAGKAHPADDAGKRLIQQMVRFADAEDVRHRVVVLPDYDIAMAAVLYPGCDVWLNTPLRPFEACGTSGMKAAMNGMLNLSVRDGWWDEWYDADNGWAIPTLDVDDPERRDDAEATALYELLEQSVVPAFYDRLHGLPARWLEMIRHTLADLGPKVQATRMVAQYVGELYRPASDAVRGLTPQAAAELVDYRDRVRQAWPSVAIEHVDTADEAAVPTERSVGESIPIRAYVSLGTLQPADVEVQVVHGRLDDGDDLERPATSPLSVAESYEAGRHRYEGSVSLSEAGPFGYTVRVVPRHPALASLADLGLVRLPREPSGFLDGDLR